MRLILALVFISFGVWAYIALGGGGLHLYWGIAFAFVLMFTSVYICNDGFLRKIKGQSDDDYINSLVKVGKASIETYTVREAITFEDKNTGCLCHLLRISDNTAIFLYGQYLYDYVKIIDDPDLNQERLFPTSEFKVARQKKDGKILRLDIGESVVEEITISKPNLEALYKAGFTLTDGEVVAAIEYSTLRAALEN